MSHKVVISCVGPDRVGVLQEVTKCVMAQGGKISETRATALSGTFSVTNIVELEADSAAVAWELQTKLGDYMVAVRPKAPPNTFGDVFGRVEVQAESMGIIAQVTEHCADRGFGFATLRTSSSDSTFNATATLSAKSAVDMTWLSNEFAELGEKLDVDIKFEKAV